MRVKLKILNPKGQKTSTFDFVRYNMIQCSPTPFELSVFTIRKIGKWVSLRVFSSSCAKVPKKFGQPDKIKSIEDWVNPFLAWSDVLISFLIWSSLHFSIFLVAFRNLWDSFDGISCCIVFLESYYTPFLIFKINFIFSILCFSDSSILNLACCKDQSWIW